MRNLKTKLKNFLENFLTVFKKLSVKLWKFIGSLSIGIAILVYITGKNWPEHWRFIKEIFANTSSQVQPIPLIIQELAQIHETDAFLKTLEKKQLSDSILAGPYAQFENIEGCYVFILDSFRVPRLYRFANQSFFDTKEEKIVDNPIAKLNNEQQAIVICLRSEIYKY